MGYCFHLPKGPSTTSIRVKAIVPRLYSRRNLLHCNFGDWLQQKRINMNIIDCLKNENNNPPAGEKVEFLSSDHIRFPNEVPITGHNYNCHRKFVIDKKYKRWSWIYSNMDGIHPLYGNNIQMASKQMKIVSVYENMVELRGWGYDPMGFPFSNYGIVIQFQQDNIQVIDLFMHDRNTTIMYYK